MAFIRLTTNDTVIGEITYTHKDDEDNDYYLVNGTTWDLAELEDGIDREQRKKQVIRIYKRHIVWGTGM